MAERPRFGVDIPERMKQAKAAKPASMFPDGTDLPLFSGTPIPAIEHRYLPEDHSMKQEMLPGMPSVDYDHVLEKDRALRRRRTPAVLPSNDDIFTAAATRSSAPTTAAVEAVGQQEEAASLPAATQERHRSSRERTE